MWVRGCWTHPACYLRPGPVTSTGHQTTEHKTLLLRAFSKYQGPWSKGIHNSFHPESVTESAQASLVAKMPPRVQPESLLLLSRQCLVDVLLKRSKIRGDFLICEKSWLNWMEVATTLLTPSITNTTVAKVFIIIIFIITRLRPSVENAKRKELSPELSSFHTWWYSCSPPHYHHPNHYPQVIAGLENNHCCSLLAPLLSPRLTILKITEHPSYLAETELVKLFQRLPSCSTLQNIQLSAKVRDNIFHNLVVMPSNFISLLIQVTSLISEPLSMLLLTNPPASLRSLILSNCNTLLPSPQVVLVMMKIMSKIEKKMWWSVGYAN